jgi:hypothetical protein
MTATLLTPIPVEVDVDERLARDSLRAQIARLEARGRRGVGSGGPRMLGLGDLEAVRDQMLHGPAADPGPAESSAHGRLEAMLANPSSHRRERVSLRELGRPGCGSYYVGPRLGIVGMLAGWWEVKLSSGCPLALVHVQGPHA